MLQQKILQADLSFFALDKMGIDLEKADTAQFTGPGSHSGIGAAYADLACNVEIAKMTLYLLRN